MTSEYPGISGTRQPPWLEWSIAGLYHGPADRRAAGEDGMPAAGDAVLTNGIPVERLTLGLLAGRPVAVEVTDPAWLDELIYAAQVAKSRLWAFYGHAA